MQQHVWWEEFCAAPAFELQLGLPRPPFRILDLCQSCYLKGLKCLALLYRRWLIWLGCVDAAVMCVQVLHL